MKTRDFERVYSKAGTPTVPKYQGSFDKSGKLRIKEIGETDLYGFIQSHADSVDIHVILKRFENGDISALNRYQTFYGDMTEMPKTYSEMLNKVREGEAYFNSLPLEVREQFGNDSSVFLAGLSDGSTVKVLSEYKASLPVAAAASDEVKESEVVKDVG